MQDDSVARPRADSVDSHRGPELAIDSIRKALIENEMKVRAALTPTLSALAAQHAAETSFRSLSTQLMEREASMRAALGPTLGGFASAMHAMQARGESGIMSGLVARLREAQESAGIPSGVSALTRLDVPALPRRRLSDAEVDRIAERVAEKLSRGPGPLPPDRRKIGYGKERPQD